MIGQHSQQIAAAHPGVFRQVVPGFILTDLIFAVAFTYLFIKVGAALGGGCELVAACDIVIAGERARFGQPEIKLGVFPPVAAILLPRIIGEKKAREMILTGETIDATEAVRLGLANYAMPSGELQQKTNELLARLRELSSASLAMTLKALDIAAGDGFEQPLKEVENLYLNKLMKTEDANEGLKSFMEKRKPEWKSK